MAAARSRACRCFGLASVVRVKVPTAGVTSLERRVLRTIVARCVSRPRKLKAGVPHEKSGFYLVFRCAVDRNPAYFTTS